MDFATYKYYKKLEEWENIIRHVCLSREDATELGNEIYRFFKAIQPKYLKNGKFIRQYEVLFDKLLDIERLLRGYTIIDYEICTNCNWDFISLMAGFLPFKLDFYCNRKHYRSYEKSL